MVIGVSSGVGKSTFSKELGSILDIPVYHLDALYWEPNWIEASLEKFSKAQQEIVEREQWITDGNYSHTFKIRTQAADTIIYLELPLSVCLYRVVKRWIMNIGKTRPDMAEGCKEKIDWDFIKFISTTYYPRKRKIAQLFQHIQASKARKNIITLKSKQEIQVYLEETKQNHNDMT